MSAHVDSIMANHAINTDSEDLYYLYQGRDDNRSDAFEETIENTRNENTKSNRARSNKQHGGADDVPTGGFPPIFIIDGKEKEDEKDKNRQLAPTGKAMVSIKDILNSKK
jgi:hypothetical protein